MNPTHRLSARARSRLILLLIVAMFLGSFAVAAFLRFSGWVPAHGRNYGQLLQPPVNLGAVHLQKADGGTYEWAPQRNIWRLVVVPSSDCRIACTRTLDTLRRTWLGQGRKADNIDVLWFGALPDGERFRRLLPMRPNAAIASALPEAGRADAVPVYLVDPSGFLVLHYRPGFDPAGLRNDLGKLLK